MHPFPHHYAVALTGGDAGHAVLSAPGLPALETATPVEFDGPGDAWSPEHLLLAAVASCFLMTWRAVARFSRFDYVRVDVSAEGVVNRVDGSTRFTEVTLHVTIAAPAGADRDRAVRLAEKAERGCLVSASLSAPVTLRVDLVTP